MSDNFGANDSGSEMQPSEPFGWGSEDREGVVSFLAEFMAGTSDGELLYRNNYCALATEKAYDEFGADGLCQMMVEIDKRGNWVSDIIMDASDIDDVLYNKYGVFNNEVMDVARRTEAMFELNQKILTLRNRYSKKIADEIYEEMEREAPES